MEQLVVIGSGASGVHFTQAALKKGYRVTMLDVGNRNGAAIEPDYRFNDLKTKLADPARYLLGEDYSAVLYPGARGEYYGFPPHKQFIFDQPAGVRTESSGFEPLTSFARGGLAETWTGGAYPLNAAELADFPFGYDELAPYYAEVAAEIGIAGADDDLVRFFPRHDNLMPTLRLDEHSQRLVDSYGKERSRINERLGAYLGRSRIATLSADKGRRKACSYSGRCLWGCPSGALYTPSITLEECHRQPGFSYVPGMYVSHFDYSSDGGITAVQAKSMADGATHSISGDRYVLAAGTLCSSRIFLESIYRRTGQIVRLPGLMDNRQILMPFLNLKMIGKPYNPETYQYHQLAMGIAGEKPEEYIHCQITTLKTAMLHPVIQSMPLDLRTSVFLFRNARAGFGIVNINLHDRRNDANQITLSADSAGATRLVLSYTPPPDEPGRIRAAVQTVKQALWRLGCVVPPGVVHVRPMGASVHYAGTIPMRRTPAPHTASPECRSHDFSNLYFVDGTTFPFLPAKNLTFTLMANARRVAAKAF